MKLFISYARVDTPLCKQIVERLGDAHEIWYDRRLFSGQDWWLEIQRRLHWCEGFVYLLSPESVASEYCQKEYGIARSQNKHIFPVLIQARTAIPNDLEQIHYADLSLGMENLYVLLNAVTVAERRMPSAQVAPPMPNEPIAQNPGDSVTPGAVIGEAADALSEGAFDRAVFLLKQAQEKNPQGRVARMIADLLTDAEEALARQTYLRAAQHEYAPIAELVKRERTRSIGCKEFADFQRDYPDYDPDDLVELCSPPATTAPQPQTKPIETSSSDGWVHSHPPLIYLQRVELILPPPFEWVEISGGKVILEAGGYLSKDTTFDVPTFAIAKYPITNGQFAKFVELGGYRQIRWWTEVGWQQKEKEKWTEPHSGPDKEKHGADYPVVGISWYEAVAFCQWLMEAILVLNVALITLPTEQQWQRAAQGDDGRIYPWGNQFDKNKANTKESGIRRTTPVTQYPQGASPYGVLDMSGNVSEWCLSTREIDNNSSKGNSVRVLRGGAFSYPQDLARAAYRSGNSPDFREGPSGFRLVTSSPISAGR